MHTKGRKINWGEIKVRRKKSLTLIRKGKKRSTEVYGWKEPFMSWGKCKEGRTQICSQYFI